MKKVAVILSGCGVFDGSEIHESVLTFLALEKENINYECFAPDKNQPQVINHLTNKPMNENRNMLTEAARIARGKIKDLKSLNVNDFDGVILPGGFGAACNLSTFAKNGEQASVLPELEKVLLDFYKNKKPIGAICIAPNILAKIIPGVQLTIGTDEDTAKKLELMGAKHFNKNVNEIMIDEKNLIFTTPAYMLGKNLKEIESGITNLVQAISNILKHSTCSI